MIASAAGHQSWRLGLIASAAGHQSDGRSLIASAAGHQSWRLGLIASAAGHQSWRLGLIASAAGHQSDGRSLIAPSVGLLGRSASCASSSPGRSECVLRPGRLNMPATWLSDSHAAASTRAGLRLRSRLAASRLAAFPNPDAINPGRAASSFTPLRLPRSTCVSGRSASSERSHGFNGNGT